MFWENIMALWLCVLIFLFEFPLIGSGGWQHPHLCPSIFKTLAGKGRPITEGGQSSKCLLGSGGAVKAGEAAPATHPSPLELGSRGEVDQGVAPLGVGSCLSFSPGGDLAHVGCLVSLYGRKGWNWFNLLQPPRELLPPWVTALIQNCFFHKPLEMSFRS